MIAKSNNKVLPIVSATCLYYILQSTAFENYLSYKLSTGCSTRQNHQSFFKSILKKKIYPFIIPFYQVLSLFFSLVEKRHQHW